MSVSYKTLAFHGDPAIKARYLARLRYHMAAGNLVQGASWQLGKGSIINCLLEHDSISACPAALGWPVGFCMLVDTIFDNLPKHSAMKFAMDLMCAIEVGRDLGKVWLEFQRTSLLRMLPGRRPSSRELSRLAVSLIERELTNDLLTDSEWAKLQVKVHATAKSANDETSVRLKMSSADVRRDMIVVYAVDPNPAVAADFIAALTLHPQLWVNPRAPVATYECWRIDVLALLNSHM